MNYLIVGETTSRLIFEKLGRKDEKDWIPYFDDPVSDMFGSWPKKSSRENAKYLIDTILNRYENGNGLMGLYEKSSGKLIGMCGLLKQKIDDREVIEIGYHILPAERKKGYASEAAIKCKEYAFQNKLTPYVVSIIHVDNTNSKKVALNNGMKLEKRSEWRGYPVEIYRVDAPLST